MLKFFNGAGARLSGGRLVIATAPGLHVLAGHRLKAALTAPASRQPASVGRSGSRDRSFP